MGRYFYRSGRTVTGQIHARILSEFICELCSPLESKSCKTPNLEAQTSIRRRELPSAFSSTSRDRRRRRAKTYSCSSTSEIVTGGHNGGRIRGEGLLFPNQEETILEFWSNIKAFETQLERTKDIPEYIFYDGHPFATGLPNYGHILAGTIKDIVTRYQTMRGHHVTRRFGWDTHGLPVEREIDKKLEIKKKEDVLAMGIDKNNEECRKVVTRYVEEWEKVITRTGRWIDFRNDYKTMNLKFMESVWWVFGQLYEKGLVYKGFKI